MCDNNEARFGFVLTDEDTKKLLEVCEFKGVHPYDLVVESIDRLYTYLKELTK